MVSQNTNMEKCFSSQIEQSRRNLARAQKADIGNESTN